MTRREERIFRAILNLARAYRDQTEGYEIHREIRRVVKLAEKLIGDAP